MAAALAAALAFWYLYTRLYWTFAGIHATLPPCPFLLLTGHPCPFCGGTRSFASIWQGDLGRALHFHPLGPLYFAAGLAMAGLALWTLGSGRRLVLGLDQAGERAAYLVLGTLILGAWAVKLAGI